MSHYDPREHEVSLRCDGDHDLGEPYLDKSGINVVMNDGELYAKLWWVISKDCTKPYENENVVNVKETCQYTALEEHDSILVPIADIKEMVA